MVNIGKGTTKDERDSILKIPFKEYKDIFAIFAWTYDDRDGNASINRMILWMPSVEEIFDIGNPC